MQSFETDFAGFSVFNNTQTFLKLEMNFRELFVMLILWP